MRRPEDELDQLDKSSLRRQLQLADPSLKNFSSNDYLALSQHPEVKLAYQHAIDAHGAGATASRLLSGGSEPHQELEEYISRAKGTEAALSFSTGYATAVGVITAVLQKGDTVILDKLCHASLIDGARMSGATLRVFPHNNLTKLESLLATARPTETSRTLVITESVFSMDGDTAPLAEISQLTQAAGALLMVDEAHALGLLGDTGMGLAEQLGIQSQIDFQMGTLGKAAGVAGGYIACSQIWVDLLINKARSLIYSTAPPPGQAAAATAALKIITSQEGSRLREQLSQNIETFRQHIKPEACSIPASQASSSSAIIPWMVGDSAEALELSKKLRNEGFLIPAIRFPTVPKNTARLRITFNAADQTDDIIQLARLLNELS